ncbi:DUF1810 domain-containing protein [Psychrobacter aestuarii]|uniref:DUF1810 domain-containing protein n=1 Tax=Psychrobacter aestuarii TaxID=556327 RepID=A0ABP3FN60_9GAMM|nr:DUF1810 domain-containing protein [Psychrobacter aestuarii]
MNTNNDALFNDFTHAQNNVYPSVVTELTQGRKRTHWMWFIFPQIAGLGHSRMAQRFALASVAQATAYLQHTVLGARLIECAELLQLHPNRSSLEIFGTPDNLKLHSSLTLFALAAGKDSIFAALLQQFFAGDYDANTLRIIQQGQQSQQ